jgi:cytochrome c-type protein NapB
MRIPRLAAAAVLALAAVATPGIAQDTKPPAPALKAAEQNSDIDIYKWEGDRAPIPRDFVQQPPLIPHSTKGYQITKNFNKCMDCHAWSRAPTTGATKVSITHFKDREGKELSNISPGRYFCTTCHVPQTDAEPLVKNTFKPVEGLARKK